MIRKILTLIAPLPSVIDIMDTYTSYIDANGYLYIGGSSLSKYDTSSNRAQWAFALPSGSLAESITVDGNGNVYVAGKLGGVVDFGNGVTLDTPSNMESPFLVAYNPSGVAQWVNSVGSLSGMGVLGFTSVVVDTDGGILAAGYLPANFTADYGNGVSVATGNDNGANPGLCGLLIKYH